MDWKSNAKAEAEKGGPAGADGGKGDLKAQLKDKKVKCRICDGEHFTARCPFKDTMAPMGEDGAGGAGGVDGGDDAGVEKEGGLGAGGGGYVPPHLRKGGKAEGERMGGKYERDDLATLRVTNVGFWSMSSRFCAWGWWFLWANGLGAVFRSLNSRKSRICVRSSSVLDGSRGFFWPRIARRAGRRGLRLLVIRSGRMRLRRARRSMAVCPTPLFNSFPVLRFLY